MNRVLHIVSSMNRGGAETFIMNVYRNIDREKIQFDFITQTNEKYDYEDEIEKLGGIIYRLPTRNINPIGYMKALIQILKENPKYNVAHIHTDGATSVMDTICLIICGVKIRIVHSHNTQTKRGKLNKLLIPILNATSTDRCMCSNEAGYWLFGKNSVNNGKVKFIANGIEINNFLYDENIRNKKRKELGISQKYVVGHIGRFNKQKNHEFLIDIFYEIQKKNSKAILLLIGKGDLEISIKEKVKKLNISEKVIFLGLREDVRELLQAMDVFIFPSLYEGLPVTLIEAQVSGLKIFKSNRVTNEVEISDLIDTISLNENAEVWSNKILSKDNYVHKNMNNEMEKSEFNIKNVIDILLKIYNRA